MEILLHTIYYLSPQTYLSLPVNRRCHHHPDKNNEPMQGM